MSQIAHYLYRKLPDAGAQQYAYVPGFQNPLYSLPGPGTPYSFRWEVVQPQQLYYNKQMRADGLAGVVAGTMAMQGLLDTRGVQGAEG